MVGYCEMSHLGRRVCLGRVFRLGPVAAVARTSAAPILLCISISHVRAEGPSPVRILLSGGAAGFQVEQELAGQASLETRIPGTTFSQQLEQFLNFDTDGYALSGKAITEFTIFGAPAGPQVRFQASASGRKWHADDISFSVSTNSVARQNGVVTDSDRDAISGKVGGGDALSLTGLVGAYAHDPALGFLGGFVAAGRNEEANARTFGISGGLFTSVFNRPVNVRVNGGIGDGEVDLDSWYVTASAEAFLTPDWAVLFDAGYGDADTREVETTPATPLTTSQRSINTLRAEVLRLGLESRWQVEQSPLSVSIFGNYVRTEGRQELSTSVRGRGFFAGFFSSTSFTRSTEVDYFEGGVRFRMALGATENSSLLGQSREHVQDLGVDNVMSLNGIYGLDTEFGQPRFFFGEALLP